MKTKFRTLREIVDYSVNKYYEKIAFRIKQKVEKGVKATYKDISYGKMGEDIKALASYFIHKGLCGKRIVVVGDNCYEWILGYLSVVCSGNVFVPLDKNLPSHELEGLLVRSEAECIIYGPQFEDLVQKFAQSAEIICMNGGLDDAIVTGNKLISDGDTSYENVVIDENAMSILLFTSGTTSASKAVMLSQYNIACNINDLIEAEKFYDDDVYLALLPYHHVFGLVGMTLFISLGIKTVFCEGLRVAKALKEYKVSVLVLVPLVIESMYRQIERTVKKQGKEKVLKIGIMLSRFLLKFNIDIRRKLFDVIHSELGGKLRFIISGGAALKPELSGWFNDIGILTVQGYGLSETSPVVSAESHLYMKSGSIGKAMGSVDVRIDTPDSDGIGEIVVRGDNVMLGYLGEPELTAEVLKDGWFYTGDMGYMDQEGYIFITGRKKDVIVLSNGKNVFPDELEQLIGLAEYVCECIVFEDEADTLAVNVVYDKDYFDGKDEEYINNTVISDITNINKKLVSYKRIKNIYVSDEPMIKTSTAKIKRQPSIEKIKAERQPMNIMK